MFRGMLQQLQTYIDILLTTLHRSLSAAFAHDMPDGRRHTNDTGGS